MHTATILYRLLIINGNDISVGTKYRWNTRKMGESERFAHMFDKSIGLVRKWSEIRIGLVAA